MSPATTWTAFARGREATIIGTGSAVPSCLVTNEELSVQLGEDIDPFVRGTLGITQRHGCAPDERTADLAEVAGRAALAAARISPESIDRLIVATDTPECVSPATSSVVHGQLRLTNAGTFDLNAGCAGFVTALDKAWKYLRADERYSPVLVIGAYAMSRWTSSPDRSRSSRTTGRGGSRCASRLSPTRRISVTTVAMGRS